MYLLAGIFRETGKLAIAWAFAAGTAALFPPVAAAQAEPPAIALGKAYLAKGEAEQAVQKFTEHLRRQGFDADAYYWRAHALIQLGQEEEAGRDLRFLLQYHPDDSRALDALGYLHNRQGRYEEALACFNKAITHDHKNAIIYNNRGMSYYYSGNYVAAFNDFNKAVLLDSTFADAFSNRGSARYNNQNIAAASQADLLRAEADFSRALELDPVLVSAYRNRALVRLHLGKHRDCYLDLQKAIHLDPGDPWLYQQLGLLMLEKQSFEEAVTWFSEALKLRADFREALYGRSDAYKGSGRYDLARHDLETIAGLHKEERGETAYRLAVVYALAANAGQALEYLQEARKAGFFKNADALRQFREETVFDPWRRQEGFKRFLEQASR